MTGTERLDAAVLVGHATRLPGKFDLRIDGRPVLDRVLDAVQRAGFVPTIVAVPDSGRTGPSVVIDRYDRGPLGGVRAFLEVRPGPFLLVGGDMPFLRAEDLRGLGDRFRVGRSVVPQHPDGTFEVLFAIYDLPIEPVAEFWSQGRSLHDLVADRAARSALDVVPAGEFDPRSFVDLDTPGDYDRVRRGAPAQPGRRAGD
jgi:molybdopterin-guanine dinucleotide biosynthesis protein A